MNLLQIYADGLRHLNRNVRLYFMVMCLEGVGMGLNDTLYNLFLQQQGFSNTFMGELVSAKSLAAMLLMVPCGILSDRLGRRRAMLLGAGISALTLWGRIVFSDPTLLWLCNFAFGAAGALYMVSGSPFIAEQVDSKHRMSIFSLSFALISTASIIGYFMGGALPDILAFSGIVLLTGQRITLYISVLLNMVMLLPLFLIREDKAASVINDEPGFFSVLRGIPRQQLWIVARLNFSQILTSIGAALVVPLLSVFLATQFAISSTVVGTIMSGGQLTMVVATLLSPLVASRLGTVRAAIVLQLASVPFLLLMGNTSWLGLAVLGYLMRGAVMNATNPLYGTLLMNNVHEKYRGFATSIMDMAFNLGWTFFSGLGGALSEQYGFSLVYNLAALFYTGSAVTFYLLNRHLDQPVQAA